MPNEPKLSPAVESEVWKKIALASLNMLHETMPEVEIGPLLYPDSIDAYRCRILDLKTVVRLRKAV